MRSVFLPFWSVCSDSEPSSFQGHVSHKRTVSAGGSDVFYHQACSALASGDSAWAALLADHLLHLEPERSEYAALRFDALSAADGDWAGPWHDGRTGHSSRRDAPLQ